MNGISRTPQRLRPRRAAFTLIEVMIAITLFSLVMAAVYSSWNAVVRGSRVGLDAAAEAQRARVAVRALEEALLTAQLSVANAGHYAFIVDTMDSEFAALSFVSRLPASFPGSGLFGDQPVRRVTFTVEMGPENNYELIMRQQPLLDASTDEPYPIVLARNVRLFGVEFWDESAQDWEPEFTSTNQLPKLMRLYLSTGQADASRPADAIMRTVSLPNIAIPLDVQRPTPGGAGAAGRGGGLPGGRQTAPGIGAPRPGAAPVQPPGGQRFQEGARP
jgi:prepilin-type N-terminal cleavage/methylation domain-containing protein